VPVILEHSFDDYLASADDTTKALLASDGPWLEAIRRTHDFFPSVLWTQESPMKPVPMMSAMNAFMLLLASFRVALSGHPAAVFPLVRTSLEAACYAFLMNSDPELEQIWLDRHRDVEGLAKCRKAFTPAVKNTSAAINQIQDGSGDFIRQMYEAAIDFGGHPNVSSVMRHLSLRETEEQNHVNLAGLYGAAAPATAQALVACLEFGQAIALVLLRSLKDPTEEMAEALAELDATKTRTVETIFG